MKRTRSLITLCVLSLVLLAPGIAGAQAAKPGYDIQTQLKSIQEGLTIIQKQLANLPPTWSRQLPASERFVLPGEFNYQAVLDRETGLVWERAPAYGRGPCNWFQANTNCISSTVGDRKGWRLPTIQELASLIDMSVTSIPKLPTGHPFLITTPYLNNIWSATSSAERPDSAYIATSHGQLLAQGKNGTHGIPWCVRGGSGVDLQ